MKLKSLTLSNFKGIKKFTSKLMVNGSGQNVNIYGDNGTGKTTIADAYYWLLTGNDSLGNATFNIKTLEKSGEPVHEVEHTVHGVFEIDNKQVELSKIYKEDWTKKRGLAKKVLTGHSVARYINGNFKKKMEYTSYLKKIADPETFRMLTSPFYFAETLHWEKRREILLQVCGGVDDSIVIASDNKLKNIPNILNDNTLTIAECKKSIKAEQTIISKKTAKIKPQIEENQSIIDQAETIEFSTFDLKHNQSTLSSLQKKLVRMESGGQITQKQKKLAETENQIIKIETEHLKSVAEQIKENRINFNCLASDAYIIKEQIAKEEGTITTEKNQIASIQSVINVLRDKWELINDGIFTDSGNCPACGQSLPLNQVHNAMHDFNIKKAEELERLNDTGKALNKEIEGHSANIVNSEKNIAIFKLELKTNCKSTQEIIKQIKKAEATNPDYKDLKLKTDQLNEEIRTLLAGGNEEKNKLQDEIIIMENIINNLKTAEEAQKTKIKSKDRIKELEEKEHALGEEYEQLEAKLNLIQLFTKKKIEILEEKIDAAFDNVKFKLFETQTNGEIKPICSVLGPDGVPFSGGLNSGQKINTGISIINTLSKFYGQSFPIFADNAESVVRLEPTEAQVVRLVVDQEMEQKTKQVKIDVDDDGNDVFEDRLYDVPKKIQKLRVELV